jgi:hypothetical protein
MRLSWYADTGVAVFSIWQGGTCTGTFRRRSPICRGWLIPAARPARAGCCLITGSSGIARAAPPGPPGLPDGDIRMGTTGAIYLPPVESDHGLSGGAAAADYPGEYAAGPRADFPAGARPGRPRHLTAEPPGALEASPARPSGAAAGAARACFRIPGRVVGAGSARIRRTRIPAGQPGTGPRVPGPAPQVTAAGSSRLPGRVRRGRISRRARPGMRLRRPVGGLPRRHQEGR